MLNAPFGPRNVYTRAQTDINALMSAEFHRLGCSTHRLGDLLVVSNGSRQCYLLESETSFTSLLAYRAFKNKDYTKTILRSLGLSVAEGKSFRFAQKETALRALLELLPAVVKPLDGRKGRGVSICTTADNFNSAWEDAKVHASSSIIIERYFADGQDARYFVVAGKCIAVRMRLPPVLVGDGRQSVRELVKEKNRLRQQHPDQNVMIDIEAVIAFISAGGRTGETILERGEELQFDWRASYDTGDSSNVTAYVHESMMRIAERVAASVPGADVIGVDILARDHGAPATDDNYMIVEANTRPGMIAHLCPVFGEPVNVCRAIAEHCVKQMALAESVRTQASVDGPRLSRVATPSVVDRGDSASNGEFVIVLAGDTSLGDAYLARKGTPDDLSRLENNPLSFFEALAPLTSDSSLFVVNLETVLTNAPEGGHEKSYLGWDNPDRTISTLLSVGVDVVSLANNHTMDFGVRPMLGSVAHLEEAGISVIGAGSNAREAAQPFKFPIGDTNVYIISGFEYRKKYDKEFAVYAADDAAGLQAFRLKEKNELSRTISKIRASDPHSLILAYPHWGGARNYKWATPEMLVASDALLASGADLLFGHGSHMLQQCSASAFGTTVFSLGNFVFNSQGFYRQRGAPPYSLIARLTLRPGAEVWGGELRLYPTLTDNRVTGYRSRPATGVEAKDVYDILDRFGDGEFRRTFAMSRDERGWYISPTTPLSPRFSKARPSPVTARRRHHDRTSEVQI